MVLALAVHTIQDRPTARVPLSMIALLDLVKTKGTSTELKCRQVLWVLCVHHRACTPSSCCSETRGSCADTTSHLARP